MNLGGKVTKMDNPLQHYTADMVYKSRVKYPYVRKSYLENPDNPKPELRRKDEFVRVSYDEAVKLIAKELKKQEIERRKCDFWRKLWLEIKWKYAKLTHLAS